MCGPTIQIANQINISNIYYQSLYGGNLFIKIAKEQNDNAIYLRSINKSLSKLNTDALNITLELHCIDKEKVNVLKNSIGVIFWSMLSSQNFMNLSLLMYEGLKQKEENKYSCGKYQNLTKGLFFHSLGFCSLLLVVLIFQASTIKKELSRSPKNEYFGIKVNKYITLSLIFFSLVVLLGFTRIRKVYGIQLAYLGGVKFCGYFAHLDARLWSFLLFTFFAGFAAADERFMMYNWLVENRTKSSSVNKITVLLSILFSMIFSTFS